MLTGQDLFEALCRKYPTRGWCEAHTEPIYLEFLASLDGHRGIDVLACFEAWLNKNYKRF